MSVSASLECEGFTQSTAKQNNLCEPLSLSRNNRLCGSLREINNSKV